MDPADVTAIRDGQLASELRASDGWRWFEQQVQESIDYLETSLLVGGETPEDDHANRAKRQVLIAILNKPHEAVERAEATRKELQDLG